MTLLAWGAAILASLRLAAPFLWSLAVAYRLPSFNLAVDIYRTQGVGGTYGVPNVTAFGNLSPGKLVSQNGVITGIVPAQAGHHFMDLRLPAGTDIRANWNGATADIVEVPSLSGRFYLVVEVDDMAKGFANEHRVAFLLYLHAGTNGIGGSLGTPAPVPMP